MEKVEREFILSRMEKIEDRVHTDKEYQRQAKIVHQASKKFERACNTGKGVWRAYIEYEENLQKYNCIYSEQAYLLGFEDGILIGMLKETDKKRVLSIKDMTGMISVFDSLRTMLGSKKECWGKGVVIASIIIRTMVSLVRLVYDIAKNRKQKNNRMTKV